jgi:hypothetical protein
MIIVKLEIDNKFAASCSPLEFLRKYVLLDATRLDRINGEDERFSTPNAIITVAKIEQI